MVSGLVASLRGAQHDTQMAFEFGLPDELMKRLRAQPGLVDQSVDVGRFFGRGKQFFARHLGPRR